MWAVISTIRSVSGYSIPTQALGLFFGTLAVQLNAARPIPDSLISGAACSGDGELEMICNKIAPELRRGVSLCSAIRPHRHRFPELVYSLLEVGEASGSLADSSERLARTYDQATRLQREQSLNVYHPGMYLLGLVLLNTVHEIQRFISANGPDAPITDMAYQIAINDATVAFGLVLMYYTFRAVMPILYRWEILRLIVDTIKLALPRVGLISRNLSAARWARSFAVLWGAGVNISTALEISSRSALNIHYEKAFQIAAGQTRRGRSLSESLAATQLMPRHLLTIIRSCEITGKLDTELLVLATNMESEAFERSIVEMNRAVFAIQAVVIGTMVVVIFSQSTV